MLLFQSVMLKRCLKYLMLSVYGKYVRAFLLKAYNHSASKLWWWQLTGWVIRSGYSILVHVRTFPLNVKGLKCQNTIKCSCSVQAGGMIIWIMMSCNNGIIPVIQMWGYNFVARHYLLLLQLQLHLVSMISGTCGSIPTSFNILLFYYMLTILCQ